MLPGAENAGKPGYYTVKPGDTMIRIGLEQGQNWRDIVRWNGIETPTLIEVGQVLRVVPPQADASALASQAAVAIENRQLLDDISRLFDGFVQASVFAIEQRDPTTSGHSFRVAELCLTLANQLPHAPSSRLREQALADDGLRELRYAALLHDFGKVGVREHVLVKAKKLPEQVLENLRYRVALAQENLHNQTLRKMLHAYRHQGGLSDERRLQLEAELASNAWLTCPFDAEIPDRKA